jgi:hypothetical protein
VLEAGHPLPELTLQAVQRDDVLTRFTREIRIRARLPDQLFPNLSRFFELFGLAVARARGRTRAFECEGVRFTEAGLLWR